MGHLGCGTKGLGTRCMLVAWGEGVDEIHDSQVTLLHNPDDQTLALGHT